MPCLETVQLLEAKVKRLEQAVSSAFFEGFMSGYNQEECLIDPEAEARLLTQEKTSQFAEVTQC